jgi:hypothetical protein
MQLYGHILAARSSHINTLAWRHFVLIRASLCTVCSRNTAREALTRATGCNQSSARPFSAWLFHPFSPTRDLTHPVAVMYATKLLTPASSACLACCTNPEICVRQHGYSINHDHFHSRAAPDKAAPSRHSPHRASLCSSARAPCSQRASHPPHP